MKDLKELLNEELLRGKNINNISEGVLDGGYVGSIKSIAIKDTKNTIKQFLRDNYKGRCKISKNPDSDGKYIVDCDGDLICRKFVARDSITNEFFKFGVIKGSFTFKGTQNVTSLEGGPVEVGGTCRYYDVNVETLEGAPKSSKFFECTSENLTSLKGCPTDSINFGVSSPKLTTLKDSPKSVETYNCSGCSQLKTLEGIPSTVEKLYCQRCTGLESLKGCPSELKLLSMDNCWQFGKIDITKVDFPKRVETIHNGNCGWLGEDIATVCDFDTCTHSKNPAMRNGDWKK